MTNWCSATCLKKNKLHNYEGTHNVTNKNWLKSLKIWVPLLQSIIAAVAVVIGGLWTWHIFKLDEEAVPHADVSQSISQWKISNDMRYISAIFEIKNTGSTRLNLTCGQMYIQQVLPMPETDFSKNELEPFLEKRESQPQLIPWETLQSKTQDFSTIDETIGPGETDHIAVDFLIPTDVNVVMLFGFFERDNPGCKYKSDGTLSGRGMISRAVYKMSDDSSGGN